MTGARRSALVVLGLWAASRLWFFVVGALGHARFEQGDVTGAYPDSVGDLSFWAHWDGRYFVHIALDGYESRADTAFFPLYPLTIRVGVELGLAPAVAGVAVSFAASLAALWFVHVLGRAWVGERAATAATAALAFFPTGFFLGAVYTEALFLALSAGTFWALCIRRDLLVASVFAYFAALTRNTGILLVLPLGYEWVRNRPRHGWLGLVGVVGPVIGFVTYVLYLWRVSGEPLLFSQVQGEYWGRERTNPLLTAWHALERAGDGEQFLWPPRVFETPSINPPFQLSNTLGFASLVLAVVLAVVAARRLPSVTTLYAVPALAVPLAFEISGLPLLSYPRFVLVVFPLFLALGTVLARSRVALAVWLAASAALGAYLTLLFATWRWVA